MLLTNAVNSFGGGLVLPFLWFYLTKVRGLPDAVPAATFSVQAVSAVFGALTWGAVVDKFAYRTVIPIVMTTAAIGTSLYSAATSPFVALLAALIYGFGISGVGTILRKMYAVLTTGDARKLILWS